MERTKNAPRRRKVKLIFNPSSGAANESSQQLMDTVEKMQALNLIPEVYMLKRGFDLYAVAQEHKAKEKNMLFAACGGDGTVSAVARALTGLPSVTMGIIPTGTQNNIALSLGIPNNIEEAVSILRKGRRMLLDSCIVSCNQIVMPFFEVCSIGLVSAIFPAADDIQHGKLKRIGDFLGALVEMPPSGITMVLDGERKVFRKGHVVLIANMPFFGRHYKIGGDECFCDGLLDILIFSQLSKLDLMGYAIKGGDIHAPQDPRIEHFFAREAELYTAPFMPVMADGIALGEGVVKVRVCKGCLGVMTAPSSKKKDG